MPAADSTITYRLFCSDPRAHLFHVVLTVLHPNPAGSVLSLPAWIPGSYMIREFSRNIVQISARSGRRSVALTKVDKHTWHAAPCDGRLVVEYDVYARDLSVRSAHLDESHAFFNGSSVFLSVRGHEKARHIVQLVRPAGRRYAKWAVATTLARDTAARERGFGNYRADSYDELIDHPVEMGQFTWATFEACGVPHAVAITGLHDCDTRRLCADLKQVCETQIRFFHGPRASRQSPPFSRYLFLVMAVGEGYGGLEHRSSTALLCSRNDLPFQAMGAATEAYRGFLGLCSHEYFHAWNVKQLKPAVFAPYDLTRENYTRLLWAFEGITSYYDDVMLLRAGVISMQEYLDTLARTIRSVLRGAGRLKQSVADSSFDAWTKYYRQDENAPNAVVSYYTKGALVALCIDLMLRQGSGGQRSLDDVMRKLWREYGAVGQGIPEAGIEAAVLEIAGPDLRRRMTRFFGEAVHGITDLPLKTLLLTAGFDLRVTPGTPNALGARLARSAGGIKLTHVLDQGAAQRAGLSAGDEVVALNGIRVSTENLEGLLARLPKQARVEVHAFRRDELISRVLTPSQGEVEVSLKPLKEGDASTD